MCGYADGVLGFSKDSVMKRNLLGETTKIEPPADGRGLFSAVVMDFDDQTGKCTEIFPIYFLEEQTNER